MPDAIALEAREVSKRYGAVIALERVSLEVRRAECVALIGESGSGKTTLLRCFNRLTDPDAGTVLVDGADAAAVDPVALRRRDRLRAPGRRPAAALARPPERGAGALASRPCRTRPARADRALRLVGLEPAAVGQPLAARALRRPAPAGGRRPRAGRAAGRRPARRAVRRARRDHPRRPAGRLPRPPPRARAHHAAGDARPVRGLPARRPDRGDARRAGSSRWPRPRSCAPRRRPPTCGRCSRGRGCRA